MKKRGVSPLIASVLLIAFTIMLFVLISTWVRKSTIEPSMSEAGEKLGSALECINTRIEIINICKDTNNKLKVDVDNIGDTTLITVGIRVIGTTTSPLEELLPQDTPILPYGRLSKTSTNAYTTYGELPWKVEVYPKTKTGICRDAMDVSSGVNVCPA